jgi:hypothetical protein
MKVTIRKRGKDGLNSLIGQARIHILDEWILKRGLDERA